MIFFIGPVFQFLCQVGSAKQRHRVVMHAVSELETKQEAGTYDFEVKHTAHLFFANFQSIIVRYLNSIREASSNIDMFAIIA